MEGKTDVSISEQMVELLDKRLEDFKTRVQGRFVGLAADVDSSSGTCSSTLLLQQRKREGRRSHQSHGSYDQPRSNNTATSNVITMDRLFGKKEVSSTAVSSRSSRMEMKPRRTELERTLHHFETTHVGRMVEDLEYHIGNPPFRLDARLLLEYVAETIKLTHGQKTFRQYLLSRVSCSLLVDLFWFVFCIYFQPDSYEAMECLLDSIAAGFVKVLGIIKLNVDVSFEAFPFAHACAVCLGFHFIIPGSRHRYTQKMKRQTFVMVCQLLSGMSISDASVILTWKKLFPNEINHPADLTVGGSGADEGEGEEEEEVVPRTGVLGNRAVAHRGSMGQLQRVPESIKAARRDSILGLQQGMVSGEDVLTRAGKTMTGGVVPADELMTDVFVTRRETAKKHKSQTKQVRLPFEGAAVSPLLQRFLKLKSETAGRPGTKLRRTTPMPWVKVGGASTFKSRRQGQRSAKLTRRYFDKREDFREAMQDEMTGLRSELAHIDGNWGKTAAGGVNKVSMRLSCATDGRRSPHFAWTCSGTAPRPFPCSKTPARASPLSSPGTSPRPSLRRPKSCSGAGRCTWRPTGPWTTTRPIFKRTSHSTSTTKPREHH